MYTYSAYGLGVQSDIPLLEFTPSSSGSDVAVRYAADDGWSQAHCEKENHLEISNGHARFWFKKAGSFSVRQGTEIHVIPNRAADERMLRLYVQGMLMAMLLHQRGLCVLHASVMNIGGKAVGFLGHVGAGKSSMAAALLRRGHALMSDDNAAIQLTPGGPIVSAAYPSIKLFPQIASSLGYASPALRELHSSLAKVSALANGSFAVAPCKLDRLFVLGHGFDDGFTSLDRQCSLIELIRHSVPTRWGVPAGAQHLLQCGELARCIPVIAARTFHKVTSIPALAESIEEHCRQPTCLSVNC